MLSVLSHQTYRHLFLAQAIALVGTGLLTVALGLLAYDLAGERAGAVLGIAFTIKMVAYVGLSPIASALVNHVPRRTVLVCADLVRASVALFLPFIDSIWQIYGLIFLLQSASAVFTPAFQAVIPDILPREKDYTKALSLSRLAYDIENLVSPVLAGALLAVMSYHWLFGGTVLGFVGSAALVLASSIPAPEAGHRERPFSERLTRGIKIYLATPRLRGLLSLTLAAAAASAFVLVNSVVLVRAGYGGTEADVAFALAAFGGGSMLAALTLPRLLDTMPDRTLMVAAGFALAGLTLGHGAYALAEGLLPWLAFLVAWAASGALYSAILTPSGRLLTRSSHAEDRPALFAAQFALSHTCWLLTYPIAGWAGEALGLPNAMAVLGILALAGAGLALILWPADDQQALVHSHPSLPRDHPHLREHGAEGHRHGIVIDDDHRSWPTRG